MMADKKDKTWYATHNVLGETPQEAKLKELHAELARLRGQLHRLEEMQYAVEAGNAAREPVGADELRAWFHYVHTGSPVLRVNYGLEGSE